MFTTDRSLLNPKFEGYKLDPLIQEEHVYAYPLDRRVSQAARSQNQRGKGKGRAHLHFEEMRNRIRHNHVYPGLDGQAMFFDEDGGINIVRFDGDAPVVKRVYELPVPMDTDATASDDSVSFKEYPSAVALTEEIWFVSDGNGQAYVIRENPGPDSSAEHIIASYEFYSDAKSEDGGPSTSTRGQSPTPFMLWAARPPHLHTNNEATILISTSHRTLTSPKSDAISQPHPTQKHKHEFRIHAITIPVPSSPNEIIVDSDIHPLLPLWSLYGTDVPFHAEYSLSHGMFLVLSSTRYMRLSPESGDGGAYKPTPDELAPIPRAGENLDAAPPPSDANSSGADQPKPTPPPPYSWTQTSDSLTVSFAIPSSIPTSNMSIIFARKALSILIKTDGVHLEVPGWRDMLPRFALRELWGECKSTECVWTFDRDDNSGGIARVYGLLTLHIEKQHEGTRWPQVFAHQKSHIPQKNGDTTSPNSQAPDPYLDVPESLDPSELASIREMLEKYTQADLAGVGGPGLASQDLGLGSGIPSLATGEMDEEVDSSVGRNVGVSWIPPLLDGNLDGGGGVYDEKSGGLGNVDVLTTPLPLVRVRRTSGDASPSSIVIKRNVDGLLYSPESSPPSPTWVHKSTYPALSFVLASKQDVRFSFHLSDRAVLAFDSGSSASEFNASSPARPYGLGTLGGNVYIYRNAQGDKWGKQIILKVCAGDGMGSLLGVVAFPGDGEGKDVKILCLCEKGLKVLKGLRL